MTKQIYYSHPMELNGEGLIDDCGRRALECRAQLSDKFSVWVPEENQAGDHGVQERIDLDALLESDILIVDFYHFGMEIHGATIMGKGTNQEIGFTKAMNKLRDKKVPIIQIIRQTKKFHCFDVEGRYREYGVTKNVRSLDEACQYIEENL